MKKISNSKRGFTLTELLIVVAIIVIVASASFVGVAVVLERAKETDKKGYRDENSRELFEVEAWKQIDELTKDAAKFFDVSLYKPVVTNTPTATPTPTTAPVNDNPDDNKVETEEERRARESAEASIAESIRVSESIEQSIAESIEESKRLEAEKNKQGSVKVNQELQQNGSFSVTANANKTIKSITVNWEKTSQQSGSFIISYEDSNGGNFNNASQGIQTGWNEYSGSQSFTPQANGRPVSCSKLVFSNPYSSTDVKIVSYTIEYED